MGKLDGRVAIVTGAGRGIGAARSFRPAIEGRGMFGRRPAAQAEQQKKE